MQVIIGVDPHKASHTAVAIDTDEAQLDSKKVRASRSQVEQLLTWAEPFGTRTWAIEGADGMGYLLAQQLLARGEHVINVPATLAARTRVLGTGRSSKSDPNDALSVARTALRTAGLHPVRLAGHSDVLRLLAKRNTDIGDHRTRLVCRLHALLLELDPGGIAKEINASDVERFLAAVAPATPAEQVRFDLATELLDDVRRVDEQLKASHKRIRTAVAASGTTLTNIFGVGPISPQCSSATPATSPDSRTATTTRPTTAPHPSSSPPAAAPSTGSPPAATASSTTRSTWPRSASSANPTPTAAPTSTDASSKARRRRKPARPQTENLQRRLPTPRRRRRPPTRLKRAREDTQERLCRPARPAHILHTGSSDQVTSRTQARPYARRQRACFAAPHQPPQLPLDPERIR
jgi:hypothetical protein